MMEPRSQDYLIDAGYEAERHRGNLLVSDLISLNSKLWLLADKEQPSNSDQTTVAKHILSIVQEGSPHTLPSSIAASESFFTGGGRFLKKDGESWEEISDAAATTLLTELIEEEVQFLEKAGYGKEPDTSPKDSDKDEAKGDDDEEEEEEKEKPRRDKRQKTNSGEAAASKPASSSQEEERVVTTKPNTDDIVLIDRNDSTEKTYVDHAGNALLILEVSQFFTDQYMLSRAAIKGTRADAALATVYSLLGPVKSVGEDGTTATKTRFLLRPKGTAFLRSKKDVPETWEVLTYTEAAEFVLMLLFDKLVDKENIAATLANAPPDAAAASTLGPSTVPVKNFTDHDVLFGRGGLTNTHPGNRRFRDIILLHRPDYVRAIKIEKPNVARRIVRAIRCGPNPGRFLKKDPKNGNYYDVGDRHAAEKTSQALREKTQAEKAARFDDDKRKRLREGGLSQLASQRGARMYPVLPLPAFSPAELQKMVQAPFGVNMAGVPMAGAYGVPAGIPVAMPPSNGDQAIASPNGTKAAAASVTAAGVAAGAGGDDDQKIAAQDRFDSEGNIIVTDADVIAGRGGRSNHHKGNKRFRDLVALHRPDYVRAAKIHKPAVARMIVRALRNSDPPGRFLKKDDKTGKWFDIGDKKAAEKASQALREKTPEERDQIKTDVAMPPSYFTNTALFQATSAMIRNGIPGLGGPVMPFAGVAAVAPVPPPGQQPTQGTAANEQSDSSPSKKGKETADAAEAENETAV